MKNSENQEKQRTLMKNKKKIKSQFGKNHP